METTTQLQSVCFAYFGDGNFIGWYGGTTGNITANSPKVYSSLESTRDTITTNFRSKMQRIKRDKPESIPDNINPAFGLVISIFQNIDASDSTILSQYKSIELRVVPAPIYDGPNPNFDKDFYDKLVTKRNEIFNSTLIPSMAAGSIERLKAVKQFNVSYPEPKCDNWIYGDYSIVKEWAKNPPTEFIEVITQ